MDIHRIFRIGLFVISLFMISITALGQETTLMIRVKSKDAKFIGSSIGGAKIVLREELTGKILAEGITEGSTGDTEKIMKTPHVRNARLSDDNTAGFLAKLNISEPVFITVEAYAPFNKKQARVNSSTQLWVIPGKHITGDGIVLEVPGFVVDILSPQTHERIESGTSISLAANVVMMCGCPVTEGGTWDARQYQVKALISKEGKTEKEIELKVTGKASTFEGNTSLTPGNYQVLVYAYDPVSGNTGVDKTNIIVN